MFWDIESTNQQTQPSKNSNKVLGDFFGGGFFCRKVFLCLIFAWGLGAIFYGRRIFFSYGVFLFFYAFDTYVVSG